MFGFFPDMPGMRKVYRVSKASVNKVYRQAKSGGGPADKLLTNLLPTTCEPPILFQETVYIKINLFVPPKKTLSINILRVWSDCDEPTRSLPVSPA